MEEELIDRIVHMSERGNASDLSALCRDDPTIVNSVAKSGLTPLMASAWGGKIDNAIYLVEHGAKLDSVSEKGATALHYAVLRGHWQIAKYLLQQGANANQCVNGYPGLTPLCLACQKGFETVVEVLLDAGADMDRESRDGSFPLFSAVRGGSLPVVKILIKRGADLNKRNNGQTARDAALRSGRGDIVGYIDFSPKVPRRVDGKEFVEAVCAQRERKAGDILVDCAKDECDWLELKASFYVSASDPDLEKRETVAEAERMRVSPRALLDQENLGRIAKSIIALHNTRGGVVLVGVSPDAAHRHVPLESNDPDGILERGGLNDYVKRACDRLNKIPIVLSKKKRGAVVSGVSLAEMYVARLLKFKGCNIVALVVAPALGDNIGITKVLDEHPSCVAYRRTSLGDNESRQITTLEEKNEFVAAMYKARANTDLLELMKLHDIDPSGGRYFDLWPGARERFFVGFLRMDGRTSNKEMLKDVFLFALILGAGFAFGEVLRMKVLFPIVQCFGMVLMFAPLVRRTRDLGWPLGMALVPMIMWIVVEACHSVWVGILAAVIGIVLLSVMAVKPGRKN